MSIMEDNGLVHLSIACTHVWKMGEPWSSALCTHVSDSINTDYVLVPTHLSIACTHVSDTHVSDSINTITILITLHSHCNLGEMQCQGYILFLTSSFDERIPLFHIVFTRTDLITMWCSIFNIPTLGQPSPLMVTYRFLWVTVGLQLWCFTAIIPF